MNFLDLVRIIAGNHKSTSRIQEKNRHIKSVGITYKIKKGKSGNTKKGA